MTTVPEAQAPVITQVEAAEDITVIDLEGELDISVSAAIAEQAEAALATGRHLVINLSEATFIDSSTIHALFRADAAAKKAGRKFVLQFGSRASVARVLEITGADAIFPIAPTREAAIDLVRASATAAAEASPRA